MQETPAVNPGSQIPSPAPAEPKQPSKKRTILLVCLGVALISVAIAAALFFLNQRQDTASGKPSVPTLTLYYRDGQTVLWDSTKQLSVDTETSGFVTQVKRDLATVYTAEALKKGNWRVTTSLDSKLQAEANKQVTANQTTFTAQRIKNGALVAQDVTNGQVVSWIGGLKDFDTNDDTVSQKTTVGSLALPLTYASLIETTTSYGAGTIFTDLQAPLEGFPCTVKLSPSTTSNCLYNYDLRFLGKMTLRQALGVNRIVPAATAGQTVGATKLAGYFNKLLPDPTVGHRFACYAAGSPITEDTNETQCYLSSALGEGLFARPQDIIQAYSTLANGGKSTKQVTFLSATVDNKPKPSVAVTTNQSVRPDTAYIITDILSDPSSNYLPSQYDHIFTANGSRVSVQSGSTNTNSVNSMIQYTNKYAVGFWGFREGQLTPVGDAVEKISEPIVTGWLGAAQASVTGSSPTKPATIKELPSPVITVNLLTGPVGPSPAIDLYPGWYK